MMECFPQGGWFSRGRSHFKAGSSLVGSLLHRSWVISQLMSNVTSLTITHTEQTPFVI